MYLVTPDCMSAEAVAFAVKLVSFGGIDFKLPPSPCQDFDLKIIIVLSVNALFGKNNI